MKIRGNQEKKDYYIYERFYTNLMVTIKQKSRTETQNIKKEELEGEMIENHQTIIADRITKGKKQWRYRATRNLKIKMAAVSPSLSIIILKVHRLNSPIKRY